ncbi:MAG: SurA N-terminal domain-containing protein [Succinivibrionaceae bacterium]|nr:SurA N-terminal domain-containing protein [Ruminobacter sp.]MEE1339366.1 SurA N-terminal domain-containing protein [Succinivibrionaceae bacterium]
MLTDKLREGATGPIAKIIFSLIIISFLIAGIGTYLVPRVNFDPVVVDGVTIPHAELENQVRVKKNALERQLGAQAQAKLNDKAFLQSLRKDVLEQMINDQVISSNIYKSGIIVNDDLVKRRIFEMPEFMVDGKFSQEQYIQVLARAGYNPNSFAEVLRGDTSRIIYLHPVIDGEFALPHEIDQLNKIVTEQRTFKKLDVNLDAFSQGLTASDEELNAYYNEHKEEYPLPEKVKLSYIFLTAHDLEKDVKYTDEDLQKYFNLHTEIFSVPEKRTVAHILVTGDDAEAKIKDIKSKLDAGGDFASLAKEYSEDPSSKDNGGQLPAFSLGNMDATFEKVAFNLKNVGEVSEPVNSQYGWHIVKLVKVDAARNLDFNEVKQSVIDNYAKEQSKVLFEDKLQIIENNAYENPDSLDAAVSKANDNGEGVEPSTTVKQVSKDYFTFEDENLENVLKDETVRDNIKAYIKNQIAELSLPDNTDAKTLESEILKNATNSDVVKIGPTALFVFHIDGYVKPEAKPLAEVKDDLTKAIVANKAKDNSKAFITKTIADLNAGKSVDEAVKAGKLKEAKEYTMSLFDSSENPQLALQAFEMGRLIDNKPFAKEFADFEGNPYIIVLNGIKEIEVPKDDNRDAFIAEQSVKNHAVTDNELLINTARADAEIEYNQDKEYLKMLENQSSDN